MYENDNFTGFTKTLFEPETCLKTKTGTLFQSILIQNIDRRLVLFPGCNETGSPTFLEMGSYSKRNFSFPTGIAELWFPPVEVGGQEGFQVTLYASDDFKKPLKFYHNTVPCTDAEFSKAWKKTGSFTVDKMTVPTKSILSFSSCYQGKPVPLGIGAYTSKNSSFFRSSIQEIMISPDYDIAVTLFENSNFTGASKIFVKSDRIPWTDECLASEYKSMIISDNTEKVVFQTNRQTDEAIGILGVGSYTIHNSSFPLESIGYVRPYSFFDYDIITTVYQNDDFTNLITSQNTGFDINIDIGPIKSLQLQSYKNSIVFYNDIEHSEAPDILGIGAFTIHNSSLPKDDVSSFIVGSSPLAITLYANDDFTGLNATYIGETYTFYWPFLDTPLNNDVESVVIETVNDKVAFFNDCSLDPYTYYGGYGASVLGVGAYTIHNSSIPSASVSEVYITPDQGLAVTLFANDDFTGTKTTLFESTCLSLQSDPMDKQTQSVIIKKMKAPKTKAGKNDAKKTTRRTASHNDPKVSTMEIIAKSKLKVSSKAMNIHQ